MTTKKFYLVAGFLCSMLLIGVTYYLYQGELAYKKTLLRCLDYKGWELDMLDCYGVFSLQADEQLDEPRFAIFNHKDNYDLALIQNSNNFIVKGDYLYVIARQQDAGYFVGSKGEGKEQQISKGYYWQFKTANDINYEIYDRQEDVPYYLKAEYKTGIVTPYLNYEEMPVEDQSIFHELETRIAQE